MSLMVSYFALSFSHDMSWMRSGPELRQFPRTVLPTLVLNGFPLHGKQIGNQISRSPFQKGIALAQRSTPKHNIRNVEFTS